LDEIIAIDPPALLKVFGDGGHLLQ